MDDRDRELTEAVDELADTLESLRTELQSPPRGPLGLPRPPTPNELLRFTEEYTLPTLISLLETSIKLLELLGAALRLANRRNPTETTTQSTPPEGALASVSRQTLETLDAALTDLQTAAAGGEPTDPNVKRLLEEARALSHEVETRLSETATPDESRTVSIDVQSGESTDSHSPSHVDDDDSTGDSSDESTTGEDVNVDVDNELESIKQQIDADTEDTTSTSEEPDDPTNNENDGHDSDSE